MTCRLHVQALFLWLTDDTIYTILICNLFLSSDFVYWTELRYEEAGRYVICSYNTKTKEYQEWTPKDFSARTTVHEYGGGSYLIFNGAVYFSNFKDQVLYVQKSPSEDPVAVVDTSKKWRYADFSVCSKVQFSLYWWNKTRKLQNKVFVLVCVWLCVCEWEIITVWVQLSSFWVTKLILWLFVFVISLFKIFFFLETKKFYVFYTFWTQAIILRKGVRRTKL